MLPASLAQLFKMFAMVFSVAVGDVAPAGKDGPGAVPVLKFTRLLIIAKAFAKPCMLVLLVPTFAPGA